jgi:hypothetical protein
VRRRLVAVSGVFVVARHTERQRCHDGKRGKCSGRAA